MEIEWRRDLVDTSRFVSMGGFYVHDSCLSCDGQGGKAAERERERLCFGYMVMTRLERARRMEEKREARCTNGDTVIYTHLEGGFQRLARAKHRKTPNDNGGSEKSE